MPEHLIKQGIVGKSLNVGSGTTTTQCLSSKQINTVAAVRANKGLDYG